MNPSRLSLAVIAVLGLLNLGRGAIHLFAPDGGLRMIAGLDEGALSPLVLSLIAAVGAGQIALGLVDLASVAFVRAFIRPLLLVHTVQLGLAVFLLFAWRPMPHDVPGQWGALIGFVLIGFFAALEFSRKYHVAA